MSEWAEPWRRTDVVILTALRQLEEGVVVGVGPSRAPSMTAPLRLAITETDETEGKPHRQRSALARSARWRGNGSVDIANVRTAAGSLDEADPVGHHRFALPQVARDSTTVPAGGDDRERRRD